MLEWTIEKVQQKANDLGWTLLSDYKIDGKRRVTVKCDKGHIWDIGLFHFTDDKGCPDCKREKKRLLTEQKIKDIIVLKGWELAEQYVCRTEKIKIRCEHGKIFEIFSTSLSKSSIKCDCVRKQETYNKVSQSLRFPYEEVKDYFTNNNCVLLSEIYINAHQKLEYICSCGNQSFTCFDRFKCGNRCRKCGTETSALKQKGISKNTGHHFRLPFEEVLAVYEENGCILLDTEKEYKSIQSDLKFICSCGKTSKKSFQSFRINSMCIECSTENRSGEKHYLWKTDREQHEEDRSFKDRCHKMLTACFKKFGSTKNDKTINLLKYSMSDFRDYIKSHINWEKVKNGVWHIDHIFPIQAFMDYGIRNIELINCLENLQPLSEFDNTSKGSKYSKLEFENWLKSKNVIFETKINDRFYS